MCDCTQMLIIFLKLIATDFRSFFKYTQRVLCYCGLTKSIFMYSLVVFVCCFVPHRKTIGCYVSVYWTLSTIRHVLSTMFEKNKQLKRTTHTQLQIGHIACVRKMWVRANDKKSLWFLLWAAECSVFARMHLFYGKFLKATFRSRHACEKNRTWALIDKQTWYSFVVVIMR